METFTKLTQTSLVDQHHLLISTDSSMITMMQKIPHFYNPITIYYHVSMPFIIIIIIINWQR